MTKWIGSRNCWQCGRELQKKAGGGYYFVVIKDPMGNEARLHKNCVKHTVGEGYAEVSANRASAQGAAGL